MARIITALFCLATTTLCFSMQINDQLTYQKQMEMLLKSSNDPSITKNPETIQSINQRLRRCVQNDNESGVLGLLARYNADYDIDHFNTSVFLEAQHRIHKFEELNAAMARGELLPQRNMQAHFLQRRAVATAIYQILYEHRDRGLHKAIAALDVNRVKLYAREGSRLEWKDETGKNSLDHVDDVYKREMGKPDNLENKNKIIAIRALLRNRRDQVLYWKIRYCNLELVKKMVSIGASPHYYIQEEGMTALEYAQSLPSSQNGNSKDKHESVYNFLKGVADRLAADKLAKEQEHNKNSPATELEANSESDTSKNAPTDQRGAHLILEDDNHLESLEKLVTGQPVFEILNY